MADDKTSADGQPRVKTEKELKKEAAKAEKMAKFQAKKAAQEQKEKEKEAAAGGDVEVRWLTA